MMATGIADIYHLRHCRAAVAEARITLATAKDVLDSERGLAEFRANVSGRNESERKTALTVALANDPLYQRVLSAYRAAEAEQIRAEAELEVALDGRRAEEWQVRLALVNALDRASVPSDAPGDDVSFDDTADEAGAEMIEAYARVKAQHTIALGRRLPTDTAEWFDR